MTDDQPPWLAPFVLETREVPRERHGHWDLFDPEVGEARPMIVFVHGGPIPPDLPGMPRDWPINRGYGALAADAGLVAITVAHRLHGPDQYAVAYRDVLAAVEQAGADPRVDPDRVAVWVFSGGGPFVAPLLSSPPSWLRVVAATYPILDDRPERPLPVGFRPVEALADLARPLPFVLTRVGLEAPEAAEGVARFVEAAAGTDLGLTLVDQPNGRHGFDALDYGAESRAAVQEAFRAVASALTT